MAPQQAEEQTKGGASFPATQERLGAQPAPCRVRESSGSVPVPPCLCRLSFLQMHLPPSLLTCRRLSLTPPQRPQHL